MSNWKLSQHRFPALAPNAKDVMEIPCYSANIERARLTQLLTFCWQVETRLNQNYLTCLCSLNLMLKFWKLCLRRAAKTDYLDFIWILPGFKEYIQIFDLETDFYSRFDLKLIRHDILWGFYFALKSIKYNTFYICWLYQEVCGFVSIAIQEKIHVVHWD